MAQIPADMILWEAVLNDNPVDAIFEIGTWQGGFSWWLYAQSLARDIFFQTFDAVQPDRNIPAFENLTGLDALPARGATVFALPMKIKGGSGGPLRAIAVLTQ